MTQDRFTPIFTQTAIFTLFVALLVIVGWVADIGFLRDLGYSESSMKFNTAVCFGIVAGLMLLKNRVPVLKMLLIVSIGMFSLAAILDHVFQINLHLNEFFVKDKHSQENTPGLMSLGTAVSFLVLTVYHIPFGATLLKKVQQLLIHGTTLLALLSILGYVIDIDEEYKLRVISTMAIHTSALFFVLNLVISLTRNVGLTPILRSDKAGSLLARRMFGLMLFTTFILSYLMIQLIDNDYLSTLSAVVLSLILMAGLCLVYVSLIAIQLNETDARGKLAQAQLISNNEDLEVKVKDRTRKLKNTIDFLNETNRVASVGGWEADLITNEVNWTNITKFIHEISTSMQPDLEESIGFFQEGEDREQIAKAINDAISFGFNWDLELRIVTSKGNTKWVRTIGKPSFENAKCVRLNGTIQDITTRKVAELESRKHREFLQTIIDNVPVNIYVKDLESRKTLVNKSELDHMGIDDPSLVLGKSDTELFPKESASISREEDLQVYETGVPILGRETSMTLASGETVWYLTSKIPIRDSDGEITGLLGVSVDITNRKQDEDRLKNYAILKSKSKEMEQFAYIASHDLREPLNTVKSYLNMLFEDMEERMTEESKDIKRVVDKGIKRMNDLIIGLLDYSRLSQPKKAGLVALNEVLDEVEFDLAHLISTTNAQIICPELPTIRGYHLELKLLFQNLISNALKFTKPEHPPVVIVGCNPLKHGYHFTLEDNGIGIPAEHLDRVFDIFRRLHPKGEYPGTGIGLAHVKKIIELHNGQVWVESVEGQGSTFHFTLNLI